MVSNFAKVANRLRCIYMQGFEYVEPLDAYTSVQERFRLISMDHKTFRDMMQQFGVLVFFVLGERLDAIRCNAWRQI